MAEGGPLLLPPDYSSSAPQQPVSYTPPYSSNADASADATTAEVVAVTVEKVVESNAARTLEHNKQPIAVVNVQSNSALEQIVELPEPRAATLEQKQKEKQSDARTRSHDPKTLECPVCQHVGMEVHDICGIEVLSLSLTHIHSFIH